MRHSKIIKSARNAAQEQFFGVLKQELADLIVNAAKKDEGIKKGEND